MRDNRSLNSGLTPLQSTVIIVVALTLFRLWTMSSIELVPDEGYYWLWSRFPSAGYYDHPPMIAWWIWLSTHVLGDTQLGIRAPPILSVAVASMAVYTTVMELYGDSMLARRAAIWLNAMLLVSIGVIFATPDAPSVMFWALTIWLLARLRRTGNPMLWILIGLMAGLGCVGKYTNFFIGPGILLWLIVDPKAARWRFSPWLLAGGAVAFVAFSPVLYWNAVHDWLSFRKQFGRIGDHHFQPTSVLELLAGQFGLLNPLIAILAATACWRFFRQRNRTGDPFVFLVALTAPLLAYLAIHSLHDRVHANWPAPAYPALAIAAAVFAGRLTTGIHLPRIAALAVPVGVGLSSAVLLLFALPVGNHFPWKSPADNVLGWKALVAELDSQRQQTGAQWIATTDYGLLGEIAFYSHDPAHVQEIVERERYSYETPDPVMAAQPALLVVPAAEGDASRFLSCFGLSGQLSSIVRLAGSRAIESYHVASVTGARDRLIYDGCQIRR